MEVAENAIKWLVW